VALARWFRIRAVCDEQPNSRDAQVGDLVRQVHLLRQILPNFRQQLARAVGFRHIVVTAGRASSLFLAAERIGGAAMIGIDFKAGSALMRRVAV
jgi:hypothetical protein